MAVGCDSKIFSGRSQDARKLIFLYFILLLSHIAFSRNWGTIKQVIRTPEVCRGVHFD